MREHDALNCVLAKHDYLRSYFAQGDTGAASFLAGAAYVILADEGELVSLDTLRALAVEMLSQ